MVFEPDLIVLGLGVLICVLAVATSERFDNFRLTAGTLVFGMLLIVAGITMI